MEERRKVKKAAERKNRRPKHSTAKREHSSERVKRAERKEKRTGHLQDE